MLKPGRTDEDWRPLAKTATLYYKSGLTQEQIALRLGISRQSVGRCLKRAQDLGIVEVKIHSPLSLSAELEWQVEKTFGLHEAIVVRPPADTEESTKEALGEAGAAFLERRVKNGDTLGVSWSTTVFQCAIRVGKVRSRRVDVVPLNGSLDRTAYPTRAEYIVDRIAEAFGGKAATLAAPLIVDHPRIKASLLSDSRISAALDSARKANFALFGVGDVSEQSSLFKTGYLDHRLLGKLRAGPHGAVGDICGRFYDARGRIHSRELDERTVAIELEELRSKELSVAVAGGLRKVDAILGMLRGRYCNVLITDEDAARVLLARAALKEGRLTAAATEGVSARR